MTIELLKQLIDDHEKMGSDLKEAADDYLKKHYAMRGAWKQAEDYKKVLEQKLEEAIGQQALQAEAMAENALIEARAANKENTCIAVGTVTRDDEHYAAVADHAK